MTPRADYFRDRRKQLRRLRRCVRCGKYPPSKGHRLCVYCLEEKKLKRSDPPAQKREIKKRLAEIEEIRRRLLASGVA